MKLRLQVLEGARKGRSFEPASRRVTVGRHPASDLQFDPRRDRVVSGNHAVLVRSDEGWTVRDLDSQNGTWLNGEAIDRPRSLQDGDRIRFGRQGPVVLVRLLGDEEADATSAGETPSTREVEAGVPAGWDDAENGDGSGLVPAGADGPGLPVVIVGAAALLALGGLYLLGRSGLETGDGAVAGGPTGQGASPRAIDSLRGEVASLRRALRRSRSELDSLQQVLRQRDEGERAASEPETSEEARRIRELERRLRSATSEIRRRELAAEIDLAAIEEANWQALAQLYAERRDGSVTVATAFGIRQEGLLVTSRHVVVDERGRPRPRIAVQFARSDQVWPAELVAASEGADLAVVRALNVVGGIPTVAALNLRADTLSSGVPLAVLGYSLGGDPGAGDGGGPLRGPLVTGGLLAGHARGLVEIQGFGERGGSGSPIFDAEGRVLGVLKGGSRSEEGRKRLVAVPAAEVRRLVEAAVRSARR